MKMQVIDPAVESRWDRWTEEFPDACIFHSACWGKVVTASYRYTPLYLVFRSGSEIVGLFPLMEVKSTFTGKRGVSLPFSDVVQPLIREGFSRDMFMEYLMCLGRERRWKYLEYRGGPSMITTGTPYCSYKTHTLDLSQKKEEIHRGLSDTTKRNIRKAEASGVLITVSRSPTAIRDFIYLNRLTRRRHGLPPQPSYFLRNLAQKAFGENKGFIVTAYREGDKSKAIAASVFLEHGSHVEFKYGASDYNYQMLRANNLVMWTGIMTALNRGARVFGFGRTEEDHTGLLRYKRSWGAEETIVHYWRLDPAAAKPLAVDPFGTWSGAKILQKMPLAVLEILGRLVYRHIA